MDSRAKSLLEKIAAFGDPEGQRGRALASVRSWSKEAAALLTAEPEPCEDARMVAMKCHALLTSDRPATEVVKEAGRLVEAYASQVADKLAEELRAVVKDAVRFLRWAGYDKTDKELRMISRLDKALASTEPKPSAKEN